MTKGQDLSVEEILTSIRGVINNHSLKFGKKPEVSEDILELTEETVIIEDEPEVDLVSSRAATETSSVLRDFADQASKAPIRPQKKDGGKTIEDLVVDILRPEISRWLNNNLPSLVKQMVEKEIRRLTP